ncbi:uncharacterized protein ACIGJ3_001680 isoform 1-T1 [Trichechus inunguis]
MLKSQVEFSHSGPGPNIDFHMSYLIPSRHGMKDTIINMSFVSSSRAGGNSHDGLLPFVFSVAPDKRIGHGECCEGIPRQCGSGLFVPIEGGVCLNVRSPPQFGLVNVSLTGRWKSYSWIYSPSSRNSYADGIIRLLIYLFVGLLVEYEKG